MTRTLEQIFQEIDEWGYRVNNCFQLDNRRWRVNLHLPMPELKGGRFTSFSEKETLCEALEDSIVQIATAEFHEDKPINFSRAEPIISVGMPSGLAALLARRKSLNIERRGQ